MTYAEEIWAGRTLVAVEVEEQQTDAIAEIFRRNGGASLSYRKAE